MGRGGFGAVAFISKARLAWGPIIRKGPIIRTLYEVQDSTRTPPFPGDCRERLALVEGS